MEKAEEAVQERFDAAHKLLDLLRLEEYRNPPSFGAYLRLAYRPILDRDECLECFIERIRGGE